MFKLNYIDLFAGAGGLSEGFVQAGFKPVAHVEVDKAGCNTLRTRAAFHYLQGSAGAGQYYRYVSGKIGRDEFYECIPKEVLEAVINLAIGQDNEAIFDAIEKRASKDEIDLIVGGPPCQAYSVVGRAPLRGKANDERKLLYLEYGKFLERYRPKMFVFENVPGLLSASGGKYFEDLKECYRKLGYSVDVRLLNAWDFGVMQARKRIIIVGWLSKMSLGFPELEQVINERTSAEIFEDLPRIGPACTQNVQKYRTKTNAYLEDSGIRNGIDYVTQHVTRPQNSRDLDIYALAIEEMNEGRRLKNSSIPEKLRTQKNITDFLDRFKVVGPKPHTVIAHIAKDGHHFIHPDRSQRRSLSVREAARIQSFPDDYFFEGVRENMFRSAAFRQIGNAVPPLMAQAIANSIKKELHSVI